MPHTYRRVKLRAYKTYYIGTYESQLSTKQAFDKHTKLPVFRAGALAPTHSSLGRVLSRLANKNPVPRDVNHKLLYGCMYLVVTYFFAG